jgi:opacity protein-like surface antigen
LLSFVEAAPLAGGKAAPWYTTFGTGTRADYLLTRNLSATLDITSSYLGGPAITNTAELGARLHPEWAEHKLYPFVDVRVGYAAAYERGLGNFGDPFNTQALQNGYVVHYSNGFGVVGGAGIEYALTQRWSLTTASSVMQSRMVARDFSATQQLGNPRFDMTSLRFTVGVRYNPVRTIRGGPSIR